MPANRASTAALENYLPPKILAAAPPRICERLARKHYENFTVGSVFLPREIKQDFYNVYAFCRISDDLGDETGDPKLATELLESWREELRGCYRGDVNTKIFAALKDTIDRHHLPIRHFEDLLDAFLQDQRVSRYAAFDELLDYCGRSANPVGRIVLQLLGYRDSIRTALSDHICTALQLANFWQDIAIDYKKGRIYIPREDMQRFGYSEAELACGVVNAAFVRLMRFETGRTREIFQRGARLTDMIQGAGSADVDLFVRGGLSVLDALEHHRYGVFNGRIKVSQARKTMLIINWALRYMRGVVRR